MSASGRLWESFRNGLWRQNPGLAQILGLCPILAISTNTVNATSLGIATVMAMALSNLAVSGLRCWIAYKIRIPVFVLIIAALVTVLDLAFNAYFHSLYLVLGIFIPLITTNCIVLARVEAYAAKNGVLESTVDGIAMGLGLVWVLALLGALRELIGNGTLFAGIEMVFPSLSAIHVFGDDYPGFLLASLPPGAFFILGCLIAAFNAINARRASRADRKRVSWPSISKRPENSWCTPAMIFINVLLPAPFSPTRPWIWPAKSAKSTPRRASTPPKLLVICWSLRMGERPCGIAGL